MTRPVRRDARTLAGDSTNGQFQPRTVDADVVQFLRDRVQPQPADRRARAIRQVPVDCDVFARSSRRRATRSTLRLASSTAFTRPAAAERQRRGGERIDLGKARKGGAVQHAVTVRRTLWPRASLALRLIVENRRPRRQSLLRLLCVLLLAAGAAGCAKLVYNRLDSLAAWYVGRSRLARRSAALGPARLAGADAGVASRIGAGPLRDFPARAVHARSRNPRAAPPISARSTGSKDSSRTSLRRPRRRRRACCWS